MNCPRCGNPYAPGNRFCGYCGYDLAQATAASNLQDGTPSSETVPPPEAPAPVNAPVESPAEPVDVQPQGLTCPRCLQPNRPGSIFCFSCGSRLGTYEATRPGMDRLPAFEMGSPGSFWLRAIAYIADTLVIVLPLVFLWAILGQPLPESSGTLSDQVSQQLTNPTPGFGRLQFLVLVTTLIYDTALITLWATTLGKRSFGLYVVRTDGSRVGPGRALARHVLTAVSANFTFGFIFLVAAFRADRRGLHDLICDTVVIRRYRSQYRPGQGQD
ncbi:MAG: zinc-ribbon domain-containing protein [Chloroflexi bacterium]|nr:zinc-ribbon domain-containing protein [Chloroflexota bacterium]